MNINNVHYLIVPVSFENKFHPTFSLEAVSAASFSSSSSFTVRRTSDDDDVESRSKIGTSIAEMREDNSLLEI